MARSKTLCKTVAMVSTNLSYNFKCACQGQAKNSQLSGASAQFGPYCWLRPLNYCSLPSCSLIWICCPSIHTSLSWTRSCPFMSLFGFHLNKPVTQSGSEVQSKRNITSLLTWRVGGWRQGWEAQRTAFREIPKTKENI